MDTDNNIAKKTDYQIAHYLKRSVYKDQMDFEGILAYCQKNYSIKIKRLKPICDPDNPDAIEFRDFRNWHDNGFGSGDFVDWNGSVCIVTHNAPCKLFICAKIQNGCYVSCDEQIDAADVRPASDSQILEARIAMMVAGYDFNYKDNCVMEKFIPANGSYVEYHGYSNNIHGIGVLNKITKDGRVVMYCTLPLSGEGKLEYVHCSEIGMINDFAFTAFKSSEYHRKRLEDAFHAIGKTWNHAQKRAEPIGYELQVGQTYYYIDDRLGIKSHAEEGKLTSHKRYLSGNYFRSFDEANEYLSKIKEIRREQLALLDGNL